MTCCFDNFFNEAEINIRDGDVQINILDLLPLVKKGNINPYYFGVLLGIYITANKLVKQDGYYLADELLRKYTNKDRVCIMDLCNIFLGPHPSRIIWESKLIDDISSIRQKLFNNNFYLAFKDINFRCECSLLKALSTHPKINKLYIAILYNRADEVGQLLKSFDPRHNNYLAYHLSENRSDCIIAMIKDTIILRTLLYQEILKNYRVQDVYHLMLTML